MMKSDLQPPQAGLNADPILYGVAAGLAEIFPPVDSPRSRDYRRGPDTETGRDASGENRDEE